MDRVFEKLGPVHDENWPLDLAAGSVQDTMQSGVCAVRRKFLWEFQV
jgi:hypothetical protein